MRARAFILALLPAAAGATDYWVDLRGTGTGAANGSNVANLCAGDDDVDCSPSAGDTVHLCNDASASVGINTVGSSGSRIVYDGACVGGASGKLATTGVDLALSIGASANYLTFKNLTISQNGTTSCVYVNGSDNITFESIVVDGCGAHGFAHNAASVSSGMAWDSVTFRGVDQSCISIVDATAAGDFSDWSITNNDFSGCNTDGNSAYPSIRLTIDSSDTTSTFTNWTLTGNTFANNVGSQGVRIGYNDTSVCSGGVCATRQNAVIDPVVTGNTVTSGWGFFGLRHALRGRLADNNISGTTGNQGAFVLFYSEDTLVEGNNCENMTTDDIDGGCVDLDHGNYGVTARGNWCKDIAGKDGVSNSGYCVMVLDSEKSMVYGNISARSKYCIFVGNNQGLTGNPNKYIGNACANSAVADFYVRSTVGADVSIAYNNLWMGSKGYAVLNEAGVDQTLDYNAIYSPASGDYSGQSAASNDVTADPRVIGGLNPTTTDGFRPRITSPLCGAGTYIAGLDDYDGQQFRIPYPIGAFRCGGPAARLY